MIGHLGSRVSALLDGQLSAKDTEEAWAHVYACHACRDLVEREGWIKSQLAGLAGCSDPGPAPTGLKGSLMNLPPGGPTCAPHTTSRRPVVPIALGGGAVGAAVLGVIALGLAPGSAPVERRPPATQINTVTPSPAPGRLPASDPIVSVPLRRMLP